MQQKGVVKAAVPAEQPLRRVQVAVIGGGAMGMASAYFAARAGASVLILDRNQPGEGSSGGNAGLVVPSFFKPLTDPAVIWEATKAMADPKGFFALSPRLDPGLAAWLFTFLRKSLDRGHRRRGMELICAFNRAGVVAHRELDAELGGGYRFQSKGLLYLYASARALAAARQDIQDAGGAINARPLSPTQVVDLEPAAAPDLAGGIHYLDDSSLRPDEYLARLLAAAQELGAAWLPRTEVYALDPAPGGASRLQTTAGEFHAEQVVLAGGAWMGRLGRMVGRRLPVEGGKGLSLVLDPPATGPHFPLLLDCHSAVTPYSDLLRITGLMEVCGTDLSISRRRLEGIRASTERYLPGVCGLAARAVWRGLRPCTPDDLPLIGRLRCRQAVVVAGGHGQRGMSLSPLTGRLVADVLAGRGLDPVWQKALDPNRF